MVNSIAIYHSGGVGLGPVLEQHIDDMGVPLLGRLVQRSVAALKAHTAAWQTVRDSRTD